METSAKCGDGSTIPATEYALHHLFCVRDPLTLALSPDGVEGARQLRVSWSEHEWSPSIARGCGKTVCAKTGSTGKKDRASNLSLLASASLVVEGVLGMVGSFSPTAVRGIAWGLDGTALVLGAALLPVHHIRFGNEQLAAGFLVFMAGQTLVVSGSAMEFSASSATFGAGVGLWAVALALVSASSATPIFVRATGAMHQ